MRLPSARLSAFFSVGSPPAVGEDGDPRHPAVTRKRRGWRHPRRHQPGPTSFVAGTPTVIRLTPTGPSPSLLRPGGIHIYTRTRWHGCGLLDLRCARGQARHTRRVTAAAPLPHDSGGQSAHQRTGGPFASGPPGRYRSTTGFRHATMRLHPQAAACNRARARRRRAARNGGAPPGAPLEKNGGARHVPPPEGEEASSARSPLEEARRARRRKLSRRMSRVRRRGQGRSGGSNG